MVIQGHALEASLVGPMDPRVTSMLERDGNVARCLEITQLTQPKSPRQPKACLAGRLNVYLGSVYWEQRILEVLTSIGNVLLRSCASTARTC